MFIARALALRALLDHLESTPAWRGRWPPRRIFALGYSAGGATVLALLGAQASMRAVVDHCVELPEEGLCRQGVGERTARELQPMPDLSDDRIAGGIVLAPVVAAFRDAALRRLTRPILVLRAECDRELAYPHHAARLAQLAPGVVRLVTLAHAGHFAFLTLPRDFRPPPAMRERAGFDRATAHDHVNAAIARFLHDH